MNIKALVALTLLTILGISTGVYAYTGDVSVQSSQIQINNSNVTINGSNVTITNSTITIGEGNTIIYPSQTPTSTPSPEKSNPENVPQITSVSPINAAQSQTIVIRGIGFGDLQSQLQILSDGSVDTVWGASSASLVV